MLFKSRDEKRIFGIMNFQKKFRNENEKRIFKKFDALEMLLETFAKFWYKMAETCHQKFGKLTLFKFGCFSNLEMKKEYLE